MADVGQARLCGRLTGLGESAGDGNRTGHAALATLLQRVRDTFGGQQNQRQVYTLGQVQDRRITGHACYLFVFGVNRVDIAFVAIFL